MVNTPLVLSELDRLIITVSERIEQRRAAMRDQSNFDAAMHAVDDLNEAVVALDRLQELKSRMQRSD